MHSGRAELRPPSQQIKPELEKQFKCEEVAGAVGVKSPLRAMSKAKICADLPTST